MAVNGIGLRVTHLGLRGTSILLSDISDGVDFLNSFHKPGPVYVPSNGSVELIYSTTVALSYEVGVLRSFIQQGELAAEFVTGPDYGVQNSVFVYRPGEPNPNGNVYATWEDVYAAASPVQGTRTIQVDDSLVSPAIVPAGVWDMYDITLSGSISQFDVSGGSFAVLEVQDGASFVTLNEVQDFLEIVSVSTSPIITAPAGGTHGIFIHRGSTIRSTSGVPCIDVPGGSTYLVGLDLLGAVGTDAVGITGGTVIFYAGEGATVPSDAVVGPAGSLIIVIEKFTLGVESAQPGFAGTITGVLTLQPQSSLVFSAGSIVAPGASYLYPGGTNPGGASVAAGTAQSIPVVSGGYIGVVAVFHQTVAAANPITYDVLLNGVPVRTVSTNAATSYAADTSGNLIKVSTGDLIDVVATTAGATTPTDIRVVVGIA